VIGRHLAYEKSVSIMSHSLYGKGINRLKWVTIYFKKLPEKDDKKNYLQKLQISMS